VSWSSKGQVNVRSGRGSVRRAVQGAPWTVRTLHPEDTDARHAELGGTPQHAEQYVGLNGRIAAKITKQPI
jgi:hypothetical protein